MTVRASIFSKLGNVALITITSALFAYISDIPVAIPICGALFILLLNTASKKPIKITIDKGVMYITHSRFFISKTHQWPILGIKAATGITRVNNKGHNKRYLSIKAKDTEVCLIMYNEEGWNDSRIKQLKSMLLAVGITVKGDR